MRPKQPSYSNILKTIIIVSLLGLSVASSSFTNRAKDKAESKNKFNFKCSID